MSGGIKPVARIESRNCSIASCIMPPLSMVRRKPLRSNGSALTNVCRAVLFSELFEVYLFTDFSSAFTPDSRFHFCKIGPLLDEVSRDANLVLTTSSTSSLEFIARGFLYRSCICS